MSFLIQIIVHVVVALVITPFLIMIIDDELSCGMMIGTIATGSGIWARYSYDHKNTSK